MTARTHSTTTARGMIFIHSASAALCPHVEWALSSVLGARLEFDWENQPAERGARRAERSWTGTPSMGAELASALRRMAAVRFEVTQEPTSQSEGQRYCYTPTLGTFSAVTGLHGDILVPEDKLKHAIANASLGGEPVQFAVERLLGVPWDEELDVFRYATEDTPVRWLHQVG